MKIEQKQLKELFYYVLVGLAGTVIDFSVFYFLSFFQFSMLTAQWSASFVGFLHNHLWQHFAIFEHNQRFGKTYAFNFIITFIAVLISGPALLWLNKIFAAVWLSKLIVIALNTIILYAIRKIFIFTKK